MKTIDEDEDDEDIELRCKMMKMMKITKMMKRLPTSLIEVNLYFVPRSFYAIRPLAADQHSVQRHPRRDVCSHLPALPEIQHEKRPQWPLEAYR